VRQALTGLFLLAAAALLIAGTSRFATPTAGADAGTMRTAVTEPVAAGLLLEEPGVFGINPVTRVWAERELEGRRQDAIAELAAEFDIPEALAADIHDAAVSEEIDPRLAFSLVRVESSFHPTAVSPAGAIGLTQVMPATASWLEPGTRRADLLEPETNLRLGFRYLRQLLDQYQGDKRLALTAYNRGPGTVDKLLSDGRNPDNGYAQRVLAVRSRGHVALTTARSGGSEPRPGKAGKT